MLGEAWPQSGLVAGYHLSSETDFSGNNVHLTNAGTTTFAAGKFGLAANLGASNTTKFLYTTSTGGIDGGNITISLWVKLATEIGSSIYIFADQCNTTSKVINFIGYDYNGGTRRVRFARLKNGVSEADVYYTAALGTSNWYHFVMTYDGTNVTGYVNGNSQGQATSSGSGSTAVISGMGIGVWTQTAGLLTSGMIDEVLYFNRALTAQEIRRMYALGTGKYY